MSKKILMQGNEACVHGAIYAGMKFFAGYPITPSTEIAEISSILLPKIGGTFIQMEDELASMAACVGASVTGVKSMTATSGPGFSLKQENLGYACMAEIPCVVVNVQRCGPSTGLPTAPSQGDYKQSKWGTHGDHPIITLSPTSVKETFELTIKAFNFAEKYRTPVILLTDEIIGHLRESIELPEDKGEYEVIERRYPDCAKDEYKPFSLEEEVSPLAPFGSGYRYNITGLFHDEYGFPTNSTVIAGKQLDRMFAKIDNNFDDINIYEEFMLDDAEDIFIAFGGMARCLKESIIRLRAENHKVGAFIPKTIWPFPKKNVNLLCKNHRVFVVEMNMGQMLEEVLLSADTKDGIFGINKANGEVISPDEIIERYLEVKYAK